MSIRRRHLARLLLHDINPDTATYTEYWRLLQLHPLRNDLTVYTVIMCPAFDVFEIRLPTYRLP